MTFSDKTYNILKWLVSIVIPAVTTAVISLGEVFSWQTYTDPISKCLAILQTLLGAVFCIGNAQYYAKQAEGKITLAMKETK